MTGLKQKLETFHTSLTNSDLEVAFAVFDSDIRKGGQDPISQLVQIGSDSWAHAITLVEPIMHDLESQTEKQAAKSEMFGIAIGAFKGAADRMRQPLIDVERALQEQGDSPEYDQKMEALDTLKNFAAPLRQTAQAMQKILPRRRAK